MEIRKASVSPRDVLSFRFGRGLCLATLIGLPADHADTRKRNPGGDLWGEFSVVQNGGVGFQGIR